MFTQLGHRVEVEQPGWFDGWFVIAGSTIIHSVAGWAALAGAILLGARKGKYGPDGKGTLSQIKSSTLLRWALYKGLVWI